MGEKSKFWDGMLKKKLNNPNISAWKKTQMLVFKYNLKIKCMGFPAMIPAKEIIDKHQDIITDQEKRFLERVIAGEYEK